MEGRAFQGVTAQEKACVFKKNGRGVARVSGVWEVGPGGGRARSNLEEPF